ncbi:S8 family serine peptidase [Arthrobacter sp. PsM3]|uniref:S8 family serine peptidase n=1 Tax=Arthrobacter sp. PsM3 TaxID=3030531 RepID=UPI00263B8AF1|nr:S8 family serine peptidase [Arthrobacter sp. PsM3]MDN4646430.1 S8 family serine peptidase [Arthrobacter sp. PsM3]
MPAKGLRPAANGAEIVGTDRALDPVEAKDFLTNLRANPDVEYAEPDALMYPMIADPNDPYYSLQWDLWEEPGGMRMPGAWSVTKGDGVVVAVIDTGITDHSDLNANVLPGYDMISSAAKARDNDGRDPNPRDEGDWTSDGLCSAGASGGPSSWHGTRVAGSIAAIANNGRGITGVAPGAKILPVRALGSCGGYTSDIADSIIWAAGGAVPGTPTNPNPARVINMSLGGTAATCSATYQSAIDFAYNRGSAVVVAAGNSNKSAADVSPANCQNVITVAASGRTGQRAPYSNYGTAVDVTAPGGDLSTNAQGGIASTINTGTTGPAAEDYAYTVGTSIAAPHVAGLAALIFAKLGASATPKDVEDRIKNTARPLAVACPEGCGAGLVDATKALDYGAPVPGPAMRLNDFTGDGKTDVIARDASGELWLYPGTGAGGWFPRIDLGAGWIVMSTIVSAGDFNGDGKADVIARDNSGELWLYPGTGTGDWSKRQDLGGGWNVMTSIVAPGDFNGDGRPDLIARDSSGELWLYPNNGAGDWLKRVDLGGGWNIMSSIVAPGDFNADGKVDLVARDTTGRLWLYPGNGQNEWFTRVDLGAGWNTMDAITAPGDMNSDGRPDVIARDTTGELWLYPNNGRGDWFARIDLGGGWSPMSAIL